jgi:hypothetical protein
LQAGSLEWEQVIRISIFALLDCETFSIFSVRGRRKMKLKQFSMALAAAVMLGGLSLPEIADAGQDAGHGRGGPGGGPHGGSAYGGSAYGGRAYGGSAYSGRAYGGSAYGGSAYGGRAYSGRAYSGRAYGGSVYGRSVYGERGHAIRGHPSANSNFHGGPQRFSAVKPNGHGFKPQNFIKLSSSTPLQQATLTKQNAFFNTSKFGGREFKTGWLDHFGHRFGFRWHGAIFWPFFFGDYFSFLFWPYGYYHVFWGYGPDALLWGAFWPYGEFPYDYGDEDDTAYSGELYYNGPYRSRRLAAEIWAQEHAAAAETCTGFAPGISDLPIQQLEKIIDATAVQREAFKDLKAATAKASDILRQSCPSETPLTPLSRLDAMRDRLQAIEEATGVLKAPLLHLYGLLSGAQKKRLEASALPDARPIEAARARDGNAGSLCTAQAGFANVPADQIASIIKLTEPQKQELERLKAVSARASEGLKASCPPSVPDTILGQLDAVQKRVAGLIQAAGTIRPAVRDFYASLTDEQKAALVVQPAKRSANNR